MYNEVITLVKQYKAVDAYGDTTITEASRDVFAKLTSIGQSEFYQAQASGFKPEIKFILPDYLDYDGEEIIRYTDYGGTENVYSVIRTYRNGNELEITCKKGVIEDGNA